MILVGGTLAGVCGLAFARGDPRLLRLGYVSLLAVGLPGFALMFAGAEWSYATEGLDARPIESAWVLIGFLVAELGGLLFIVSLVLGGIGIHRLRRGAGTFLLRTTLAASVVLLVAYLIAVWAMAGKPG